MGTIINSQEVKKDKLNELPKEWHPQQSKLLKSWGEVASSYRWMHNQAYMIYKKKNLRFMLPLIVMSTVAGTANFAQATFPDVIRPYVPQIIGAMNLISAIMTTIYQFLKISEFMESHRISSINYGKLARTITVELSLPVKDRNSGGAECVKVSRTEIDRLIEQSPAIPKSVLINYEQRFAGRGLSEPEIIVINKVDVYEDIENKTSTTVAQAGIKLKNLLKKPFILKNNDSPTSRKNQEVKTEINSLTGKFGSVVSQLSNKLKIPSPTKKEIQLPKFEQINYSHKLEEIPLPKDEPPQPPCPFPDEEQIIPHVEQTIPNSQDIHFTNIQEINNDEIEIVINDVVEDLVAKTVGETNVISDELEMLRSSKHVSSKR